VPIIKDVTTNLIYGLYCLNGHRSEEGGSSMVLMKTIDPEFRVFYCTVCGYVEQYVMLEQAPVKS
jgi:hypothetical protein